jgi:hypothetical protein
MSDYRVTVNVGKHFWRSGKAFNVYDTYAHAIAQAATGLMTIYDVNRLTGARGAVITQSQEIPLDYALTSLTAQNTNMYAPAATPAVGVIADQNGFIAFIIPTTATLCYLMVKDFLYPIAIQTGMQDAC